MGRKRIGYGLLAGTLCLGGVLAACAGGEQGDGYVAVGAAGAGAEKGPAGVVPPSGKVEFVPLDGAAPSRSAGRPGSPTGTAPEAGADTHTGRGTGTGTGTGTGAPNTPAPPEAPGTPGTSTPGPQPGTGTGTGTPPTSPGTTPPPAPSPPPGPAVLVVGELRRAPADQRWCENVTVDFRNTGGVPVRSGTVTFATHIIGALGIDWATIESTQPLPAPIAAGTARTTTYRVCVESWRVPLGMHIDTQDVHASYRS
ncbi:hypothetical protein ACWGI8_35235 [Streptomyces sp. NPDC054841]